MRVSIKVIMAAAFALSSIIAAVVAFVPTFIAGNDGITSTVSTLRTTSILATRHGITAFFNKPASTAEALFYASRAESVWAMSNASRMDRIKLLCDVTESSSSIAAASIISPFKGTGDLFQLCDHRGGLHLTAGFGNTTTMLVYNYDYTLGIFTTISNILPYPGAFLQYDPSFTKAVMPRPFWQPALLGFDRTQFSIQFGYRDIAGNLESMIFTVLPDELNSLVANVGLRRRARAFIADQNTSFIVGTSWNERIVEMFNLDLTLPADQRGKVSTPEDLQDPLIKETVAFLGGNTGFFSAATPLDRSFDSNAGKTFVDVETVTDKYDLRLRFLVAMPELDFIEETIEQRNRTIGGVIGAVVGILLLAVIFAVLLVRPLDRLGHRMQLTATLQDSGEDDAVSMLSEIAEMQIAYTKMKEDLNRMKSFLPQGIMEAPSNPLDEVSGSESSHPAAFGSGTSMIDMMEGAGINNVRVGMAVNEYTACDCVIVMITTAYSEAHGTGTFAALAEEFLSAVIHSASRFRGVIEVMKPHHVVVSFGARRKFNNPALNAYRLATALSNANLPPTIEWSALIDRGMYFVGTCGTEQLRQESLISGDLDVLATLGPLVHSSLRIPIAATGRVAASLTEKCLTLPVDSLQWVDGSRVQLFAVVPNSTVGNHEQAVKLVGGVKQGFSLMCKASYTAAVKQLESVMQAVEAPMKTNSGDYIAVSVHRAASRLLDISQVLESSTAHYMRQYIGWPTPNSGTFASPIVPTFDKTRGESHNHRLEANLQELTRIKESNMPKFGSKATPGSAEASALFEMAFTQNQSIGGGGSTTDGVTLSTTSDSDTGMQVESVTDMMPTPNSSAHGMQITSTYLNRWKRSTTRLGRGTFGDVYRALHENGSIAAMKVVPLAKQTTDIDELRKELLVAASQRHENLVGFVDAEVTPTDMVVVMELMAGGSLEALQVDFGELPMPVVRRFVIDILRGLSHLHRADIIHCDIKPQNVLVGVDGICKLADFGSALHPAVTAEVMHGDEDQPQMRGTPAFMAPEVARGSAPTKASDIWSIGVLVHEMVTGERPFNNKQKQAMRVGGIACIRTLAAMSEETTDLQDLRAPAAARVPDAMPMADAVRSFVSSCLRFDPAQRPTCEELLSQEMLL